MQPSTRCISFLISTTTSRFDKHYNEQVELMDGLAERVVALGGVPLAAPHDVAEVS